MATPLFGFFDPSGMGVVSEYYMVSVPRDCGEIRSGFEMHREKNAEHSYIIKKSNQKNRIFWVSAKGGIAMSQYGDLKGYEAEYEQAIANDTVESKTRHLYQNPLYGRNWVNLPSPIPQSSWGERYYQPRIAAQNAELSELFDRALKCGAISCVRAGELSESGDNSAEYICRFTLPVDISGYARLDESSAPGELKRAEKSFPSCFAIFSRRRTASAPTASRILAPPRTNPPLANASLRATTSPSRCGARWKS